MRSSLFLLVLGSVALVAAAKQDGIDGANAGPSPDEISSSTGIVTLYSRDPLAQTLNLESGEFGRIFQEHCVRNRASDIDFDQYTKGAFSVGIEGGREGKIVDLGSPAELQSRYGYKEKLGGGQGFASIRRAGGEIQILAGAADRTEEPIVEAKVLFDPQSGGRSAPVHVDHLYLVRLTDRHDPSFERLAKLLVLAHAPGESVTIRWARIE